MPRKDRNDAWSGMGTGWSITATMLGGIAVWGGIGFLLDRLLGTADVFAALGMVLGAACSIYIVYLRYGKGEGNKRGA
jgi:F0F1-type ATP synthase assembly protein I